VAAEPQSSPAEIDLRRELITPGIEIVTTHDGRTRLHLWQPQQPVEGDLHALATVRDKSDGELDDLYDLEDSL